MIGLPCDSNTSTGIDRPELDYMARRCMIRGAAVMLRASNFRQGKASWVSAIPNVTEHVSLTPESHSGSHVYALSEGQ